MEEELKPCPYCASDTCECFPVKDSMFQVACSECFMRGPRYASQNEAIAAWNALPRRLKWTKEKPTIAGFYWWRLEEGCYQHIRKVVYVGYTKRWIVSMYNSDVFENLDDNDGEWAGPIPEPEEP